MRPRSSRVAALLVGIVVVAQGAAAAATLQQRTIEAWTTYVAATEARIERELASPDRFLAADGTTRPDELQRRLGDGRITLARISTTRPDGTPIEIPDATLQHWRAMVLLPGVALGPLLDVLQHPPEHEPFQEDMLALKVLRRQPDTVDLFIRLSRSRIVTVTYDTEHHVEYRRYGATRASSRSVATRIVEIETDGTPGRRAVPAAEDHGYLWRLNSYWRYQQVASGVVVEMESLTISRSVPSVVRFIVEPMVDRIARESIERTLASFRDVNLALLKRPPAAAMSERVSDGVIEQDNVHVGFRDGGHQLGSIRQPARPGSHQDRPIAEVGDLTRCTAARRQHPQIGRRTVGQGDRQPLAVRGEVIVRGQPRRQGQPGPVDRRDELRGSLRRARSPDLPVGSRAQGVGGQPRRARERAAVRRNGRADGVV